MGFTLTGFTLPAAGGGRSKVDSAILADATATLAEAAVGTLWLSGLVLATKGIASSDGNTYRLRLVEGRQIPVRSYARQIEEVRGWLEAHAATVHPDPAPVTIPADATKEQAKALRDGWKAAQKEAAAARIELIPEVYRTAPAEAFTFLLERVAQVTRDGVVIAGEGLADA